MRTKLSGIFFSLCLFFTPLVQAEESPQIEQFSPQGTVRAVRQVTARFSRPMVPFGDPRGIIDPFDIRCSGVGTGRWVDGKNWVFDFEEDLPAGIRCEFRLKPGLKTLSGEELGGQREFFFSTGGPIIKTSTPPGSRVLKKSSPWCPSELIRPPSASLTRASLAQQTKTNDWHASPNGKTLSFPWPLQKEELTLAHEGAGKPWVTIQSLAALPLNEPFTSGYIIKKTITPLQQKQPNQWSRGDIGRIRLEMEAQAEQTWVVVSDPIPSGSTILGGGLGRDSALLTREEERKGWAWPAYEERSFEAFRAYYEYVPKGKWSVEYTIRLNQSGLFQIPNTRVEALYFPEMLGEIPNRPIEVQP